MRQKNSFDELEITKGETLDGKDLDEYMYSMMKASNDPVWYIFEILKEEELFPWQEKMIRTFYRHKYDPTAKMMRDMFLAVGQRSGKTKLSSLIGCYAYFDIARLPDPQKFCRVSKGQKLFMTFMATSAQLAEDGIFANMKNLMEDNEWLGQWFDFNFRGDRIEYKEKYIYAQVLGSWINTAVGRTNFLVGLDEIDYFEESKSKRSGWEVYTRMNKSRDTLGEYGKMLVTSSPKTLSGPILTLARQAIDDVETYGLENVRSIGLIAPTWELNPRPEFQKDYLFDLYKNDTITLWRDYGCRPELAGGLQFPEGIYMDPDLSNILRTGEVPAVQYPHVMTIDPAVTSDKFGVGVGYRVPYGPIVVDGSFYFRKKEGDPFIMPSDVKEFLFEAVPRCNVSNFIFDAWMFPEINEHLYKKFGILAEKHMVTKDDYDMWRSHQSKLAEHPMRICWDKELQDEANQLIVVESKNGRPAVQHLWNRSKDMSDCVANIVWKLTNTDLPKGVKPRCTVAISVNNQRLPFAVSR